MAGKPLLFTKHASVHDPYFLIGPLTFFLRMRTECGILGSGVSGVDEKGAVRLITVFREEILEL